MTGGRVLKFVQLRSALPKLGSTLAVGALAAFAFFCIASSRTETAVANGDTRTLHLFHTHTGETIDATFRVDGHYDPAVLRQLNHFLRDWRNDDEISMDPRLFDAVWEAYRSAGATDRVQIYSAYRSPETNAMLRRRSRAVAEHSQHMLGKAMDTTMPGFPMSRVRDAGMKLERGGVGWYPSANFVHLDVGGVRSWPRMPYDQLMSLFPDGKTVHIASNGQTLPGYEQARVELASRGETDLPPSQASGGFFAWLFGGGSNTTGAAHEDEEDRRATAVASAPQAQPAVQDEQPAQVQQVAAQAVAPVPATTQPEETAPAVRVASLDPTDISPANIGSTNIGSMGGVLPLPPRRPADLAAAPRNSAAACTPDLARARRDGRHPLLRCAVRAVGSRARRHRRPDHGHIVRRADDPKIRPAVDHHAGQPVRRATSHAEPGPRVRFRYACRRFFGDPGACCPPGRPARCAQASRRVLRYAAAGQHVRASYGRPYRPSPRRAYDDREGVALGYRSEGLTALSANIFLKRGPFFYHAFLSGDSLLTSVWLGGLCHGAGFTCRRRRRSSLV